MSQRRCSRAWVDISVLSRLPALCDPGQAGKGRGQARMSVCDARSGVDAMLKCAAAPSERTWERHRNAMTSLPDLGGQRQQFQGRALGDHIQCADEEGELLKEGDHAAKRTRKMGRTPLLFTWLGDFTRFRVQWTRCGKGPPAVPDASVVPLPTRPPSVA
jgi:hypothetical protein